VLTPFSRELSGRCVSRLSYEPCAHDEKSDTRHQEEHIKPELLRVTGQDVMQSQEVVVNETLNDIEKPPTHQHRTRQYPAPCCRAGDARGVEQHRCSRERHQPQSKMKKTVLSILKFELLHGGRLAMRGDAHQVMPPQYLMENDAVGKASKRRTQHEAGANQGLLENGAHSDGVLLSDPPGRSRAH
jgi:hypothetical protein